MSRLTPSHLEFLFGAKTSFQAMVLIDKYNVKQSLENQCSYSLIVDSIGGVKGIIVERSDLNDELNTLLEFTQTRNLSLAGCFIDLSVAA